MPEAGILTAILLTIATAATPLLLAGLGELVAERSGVLNLGVEGMMAVGAAGGLIGSKLTGSTPFGTAAGAPPGAGVAGFFALPGNKLGAHHGRTRPLPIALGFRAPAMSGGDLL